MSFDDEDKVFKHESYGMVSLSRVQSSGRRRLFGSALDRHYNTIVLRVHRAERRHKLSMDWYHAEQTPLVEVELSAAQFAEMLTTMNVGNGVPCTLRSVAAKTMTEPPEERTETEEVREGFKEMAEALGKRMVSFRKEVATALESRGVTKATRDVVIKGVDSILQEVNSNMPFVLSQFQEATSKVVASAKAEVEAFAMHAIITAGLEHLRGTKALSEKGPDENLLP